MCTLRGGMDEGEDPPSSLLVTTCGRQETWPWSHRAKELSLPPHHHHQLQHCGCGPHLGSPVGLTLMVRGWGTNPKGVSTGNLGLPLVCGAVSWMRERYALPPSLTPLYLWQEGELVPGSREWENWPSPSPAATVGRRGPCTSPVWGGASEPAPGHERGRTSRLPSSETSQAQIQGFALAHPSIYPIDELQDLHDTGQQQDI